MHTKLKGNIIIVQLKKKKTETPEQTAKEQKKKKLHLVIFVTDKFILHFHTTTHATSIIIYKNFSTS